MQKGAREGSVRKKKEQCRASRRDAGSVTPKVDAGDAGVGVIQRVELWQIGRATAKASG